MSTKTEQAEALESLHNLIKRGDEILTVLRHVSTSGMQRRISLLQITGTSGEHIIRQFDYLAAKVLGRTMKARLEGVVCNGAGMDMGFDLVYSLSLKMFGDGYALTHRWL
jgi:hypothetical protein